MKQSNDSDQATERQPGIDTPVASPHWEWREGMLTKCGMRIIGHRSGPTSMGGMYDGPVWSSRRPDLDDPATQGCMLALVRKAWGGAPIRVAVTIDGTGCTVVISLGFKGLELARVDGETLGQALAAALLAAPAPGRAVSEAVT